MLKHSQALQESFKHHNTSLFIFCRKQSCNRLVLWSIRLLKAGWFLWFLWMNISTTEHDTMKLIASFHSESTAHSNDINISCYEKISKIGENPLIIDLAFFIKILPFSQCVQNAKQFISADSSSRAEQNGTNNFVIACMVIKIFLYNWSTCAANSIRLDLKMSFKYFKRLSAWKHHLVLQRKCLEHL